MLTNLLSQLNYKINTPLSFIRKSENIVLKENHNIHGKSYENIFFALKIHLHRVSKVFKDDHQEIVGLENLYLKGFNYSRNNTDPDIQSIWDSIINNKQNSKFTNALSKRARSQASNSEIKVQLIAEINSIFSQITYGAVLAEYLFNLESVIKVVGDNREYFEIAYKNKIIDKVFDSDVNYSRIINKIGYAPNLTLEEMESKEKRISQLEREFNKINTPDLERTIDDRINFITNKLTPKSDVFNKEETNIRLKGNLMAIRGENPSLLEVLKDNSNYTFYNSWNSSIGNEKDPLTNAKALLNMILEGYAYAYHLKFLQAKKEIATSSNQIDANEDLKDFSIKLKWLGQKNQLYDVLRQLKSKGMLANSYEDLAVFLKQNIDIFSKTALSTIQKEIGKDKRPPKYRRLDIEL